MNRAELFVARARALVGARFRPQGRDPERGIDCIGLARIAYAVTGDHVRDDYRLSAAGQGKRLRDGLLRDFRRISRRARRPGDLLLLRQARDQWHLAVLTDGGFVHADARLRRVVETPGEPAWPLAGAFRRRVRGAR